MMKNTTPGTLLLVSAFIVAVLSLIQLSGDSDAAYGLRFHALLLVVCSLLACSQTALRHVLFAVALAGSALWLALLPFNGLSTLALALLAAVSVQRLASAPVRLPPSPRCSASGCCGSGRFWSPALPFRRSSCLRHWIFSRR
jgi:NitT/TauT family transport system permease protein